MDSTTRNSSRKKKTSFRPLQYTQKKSINQQSRVIAPLIETFATKGSHNTGNNNGNNSGNNGNNGNGNNASTESVSDLNFDINDVRARLNRLRPLAGTPIRRLSGQSADDFRTLIRYTQRLYGDDAYRVYYDEVRKRFGDVSSVEPGTVGAYFAGCMLPTSFGNKPGCSVICAGSMPPPPNQGPQGPQGQFNFCEYSVILANYDGHKYQFTTLHDSPNKDNLVIFLDGNVGKGKSFPGFNDEEKELLRRYGAKHVNMVKYSRDGKNYDEVLGGFVRLDQAPSRVDVYPSGNDPTSTTTGSSSNSGLLIVLLIILILVVIFIGWRISHSGSTTSTA